MTPVLPYDPTALLLNRRLMSPDLFNEQVASDAIGTAEFAGFCDDLTEPRRAQGEVYSRVAKDFRLSTTIQDISNIWLPQAVIDKLGYSNVHTVLDWIKQLPISKRINWAESKMCRVRAKVYTAAVPLIEGSKNAPLYFALKGRRDDTWIHLTYSPNGQNIGEAVVTYNYKDYQPLVTGRIEEQNSYSMRPERSIEHAPVLEPLSECFDDEALAKATLVSLAIRLHKSPYKPSDASWVVEACEQSARRHGNPPAWPTAHCTGFPVFDSGAFCVAEDYSYLSVVTAVAVDCSAKTDKEALTYIESLPQKIERSLDAASTLFYGPTAEKIYAIMQAKLKLPHSELPPAITRLYAANSVCLDYTHEATNLFDGKVSIGVPSRTPLPTAMKVQDGNWWENFPQIIKFSCEDDKHLKPEERLLSIYNYNPTIKGYELFQMTYYPRPVTQIL